MFCSKCGNILPDNAKFCTSCGAKIENTATSVNAACDQPHTGDPIASVDPITAVRRFFTHYADFSGRSRRSEYWWVVLFNWLVSAILTQIFPNGGLIVTLWSLAILVPTLAVCVRRLHDVGKAGTFYLWILLPIAGYIILLVQFLKDSQPGSNRWGDNPKFTR